MDKNVNLLEQSILWRFKVIDDPDLSELRKLYARSAAAKSILDNFAGRKRNQRETTVARLQHVLMHQGIALSEADIRDFFKNIGKLNFGTFKIGRRGGETRFEWRVGMMSLGLFARGDRAVVESLGSELDVADEGEDAMPNLVSDSTRRILYPLRPDKDVELFLPVNLNQREANRLAEFIRTLPFEAEPKSQAS